MAQALKRIAVSLILVLGSCTSSVASACEVDLFSTGPPNADGEATTAADVEVWGLFYPTDPLPAAGDPIVIDLVDVWGPGDTEPRHGTKIVWRATGHGEFSVEAHGPEGAVVRPFWQQEHLGSMWNRPGDEWGTGWEFPEPGCWTFLLSRGDDTARISIEVRT